MRWSKCMEASMRMSRRLLLRLAVVGLALVMLLGGAGTASAQAGELAVTMPQSSMVGEQASLAATLTDAAGQPVSGADILLYLNAKFGNVSGQVEVARAITNAQGVATFSYVPRSWGEQSLAAKFAGSTRVDAVETTVSLLVEPGPQMHRDEVGIVVPGVGPWVVALVFATIWGIYLIMVLLLGLISATEPLPPQGRRSQR